MQQKLEFINTSEIKLNTEVYNILYYYSMIKGDTWNYNKSSNREINCCATQCYINYLSFTDSFIYNPYIRWDDKAARHSRADY
jgi:hypothetical protein